VGEKADGVVPADWAAWERALVSAVTALEDGGSVVVAAPAAAARGARVPASGRVRWFVPPKRRPLVPSVRLQRVEDHLRGFWVGAERFGGPFPWTREEQAAILDLGWHLPGGGDGEDFVRFWPDDVAEHPFLPVADAERAAAVVAGTFRAVVSPSLPDGAELPSIQH
jgi:hypothetical protein